MKKRFKFSNIFLISFLAVAGIFGISSAVIGGQKATEQTVMERADAASLIYFGMWADGADSDAIGGDWVHYNLSLDTENDRASVTVVLKQNAQFNFTYKRADYGTNDDIQEARVSTSISGFNGSGGKTISYTAAKTIKVTITCSNAWSSACDVQITEIKSTITVNKNDSSGGTTSPATSASVSYNGSTTITASANTGYTFLGWKKDSGSSFVSTSTSYTISNITTNATYTAYFQKVAGYNLYLDCSTWDLADNVTPMIYYWDSHSTSYTKLSGTNITTITGGTYSNTKYWGFTVYPVNPTFNYLIYTGNWNSPSQKTIDISYNGTKNGVYALSNSTSSAVWSFNSNGSIQTITRNKVLGDYEPFSYGDPIYLLNGVEYEIPTQEPQVGYTFSKWNSSSDGSGTDYTIGTGYSFNSDSNIYAIYTKDTGGTVVAWKSDTYVNAYTWGSGGEYIPWPGESGVVINVGGVNYHFYEIPTGCDKVIFNAGKDGPKTDDLTVSDGTSSTNSNYYDVSTSAWLPLQVKLETKDKGGTDYSGSDSRDDYFPFLIDYTLEDGTKDGYKFNGWHLKSDCSDDAITTLNAFFYYSTVTIYADWESGEDAANTFAANFNSTIGGICASYNTNTKSSFLSDWNSFGATYVNLAGHVKYWLEETGRSNKAAIVEMLGNGTTIESKYDYVLSKYGYGDGESNLHNFLGRTPSTRSAYRGFGLGSIFGDDGNNVTTIIIVVASSVALLSVTALSILVLKKRKHKEQE